MADTGLSRRARRALQLVIGAFTSYVLGTIALGLTYRRSSRIPRTGPVILVSNHLATTDGLIMSKFVMGHRRYPHFMIMAEAFDVPVVGHALRYCQQIPVLRGSTSAAAALLPAQERLDAGDLVVLYPEGHLTRDPQLRPGRGLLGAARLALANPEVPVVPVGIWGPRPGKWHVLHRHTAHMLVGYPVDLSPWAGRTDLRAGRDATIAIMAAITDLVEKLRGEPFDPPVPRPQGR